MLSYEFMSPKDEEKVGTVIWIDYDVIEVLFVDGAVTRESQNECLYYKFWKCIDMVCY